MLALRVAPLNLSFWNKIAVEFKRFEVRNTLLEVLNLLLELQDLFLLFAQLELIVLLSFVDDFLFFKVLLCLSRHTLSRLVQLGFHFLSPLSLTFVGLLVLDDFTLALVDDLQEKVLHEA